MRRLAMAALVLVVLLVPAVLLAQAADPGAAAPSAAQSVVQKVLLGALNGAAIGIAGYLATKKEQGAREPFDLKKFALTLVVGAVVGGICAWRNKDFSEAMTWISSSGAVLSLQLLLNLVVRNSPVKIQDALAAIGKGRATGSNPPASP